eukprot:CAMPEP_0115044016 /NCGR_PEP_ID=MMETSP0216-20121206/47213_1 /TAXON_ID=223996 /ORGANISM="Protocruzia adherens, Strain Boccale" /LENGTH=489 /DNA_ID=CAMNT_0002426447 /DNA_START=137 /DNA_END=1607 /DNA_ORIENTATION=+
MQEYITKFPDRVRHEIVQPTVGNAFQYACFRGKLDLVKTLYNTIKPDVFEDNEINLNSFFLACQGGHIDVIRYLHEEAGCPFNLVEKNWKTNGLYWAVRRGHLELVKFLSTKLNIKEIYSTENKRTYLHLACEYGQVDIVEYLHREVDLDLRQKDSHDKTGFFVAILNGHLNVVTYLHEAGENLSQKFDEGGNTPFLVACERGYFELVEYMLAHVKLTDEVKHFGDTSLHAACEGGSLEIVKTLLSKGVDINAVDTPLASKRGHLQIVKLLHERQANMTAANELAHTPFSDAILCGKLNVVKYYVLKVKVAPRDQEPLFLACKGGHVHMIEYIFRRFNYTTADLLKTNGHGVSPLMITSTVEAARYLALKYKVDFNTATLAGKTVLHHAATMGHYSMLEYLVKNAGVNINAQDAAGWTAIMDGCKANKLKSIEVLKALGADTSIVNKEEGYNLRQVGETVEDLKIRVYLNCENLDGHEDITFEGRTLGK